jgi:hypothetical protein
MSKVKRKQHVSPSRISTSRDLRNPSNLLQCCPQIIRDFLRQNVWLGQIVAVLQALVTQPEDVEVQLVPLHQVVVAEAPPVDFAVSSTAR